MENFLDYLIYGCFFMMNKSIHWFVGAVMLTSTVLVSCTDDGGSSSVNPKQNTGKEMGELATYLYQYDSIGIRHNQALAYVHSHEGFDANLTDSQAAGAMADWIIDLNATDTVTSGSHNFMTSSFLTQFHKQDSLEALGRTGVIDNANVSADVMKYVDSIFAASDSLRYRTKLQNTYRISNLIFMADADGTLDSLEKIEVMAGLFTFKHSVDYWWAFLDIDSKSGSEAEDAKSQTATTAEKDGVGAVAGAAEGYFFGGIFGAIAGSVGGPAGTLGGWAGGALVGSAHGAVTGAIVASVKHAMGWNW